MKFYRAILESTTESTRVADAPQWVVLEAGIGQAGQLADMGHKLGLVRGADDYIQRHDLGGVSRCVALKTRC